MIAFRRLTFCMRSTNNASRAALKLAISCLCPHHSPTGTNRAPPRARVASADSGDGWVKPKHGKGMLRPFQPGNTFGRDARPSHYNETVALARQASPDAIRVLIERLHDPDGRIAVVAANSILERAFGKVREMKVEEQPQAHIDLSTLTNAELALLVGLVQSGRLQAVGDADSSKSAPLIDPDSPPNG